MIDVNKEYPRQPEQFLREFDPFTYAVIKYGDSKSFKEECKELLSLKEEQEAMRFKMSKEFEERK